MRIARFTQAGKNPAFGIVELASDQGSDPDTISVITGDPLAGDELALTGQRVNLTDVRLLAPVIPRSKIIGVGRNFKDHAAELGNEVPSSPLLFFKPNTSVIGPNEPIVYPELSSNVHYEGELAVVVSRIAKQVPLERVPEVIFGYTIANDVTARDLQNSDEQWTRAKGFDTFCPIGPWITTGFQIADAEQLQITTELNGEQVQSGNTSDLVYGIAELVSYISDFTTLLPGDLILTGTPAGVGPMKHGDEVSVSIEGLGALTNPVVQR